MSSIHRHFYNWIPWKEIKQGFQSKWWTRWIGHNYFCSSVRFLWLLFSGKSIHISYPAGLETSSCGLLKNYLQKVDLVSIISPMFLVHLVNASIITSKSSWHNFKDCHVTRHLKEIMEDISWSMCSFERVVKHSLGQNWSVKNAVEPGKFISTFESQLLENFKWRTDAHMKLIRFILREVPKDDYF